MTKQGAKIPPEPPQPKVSAVARILATAIMATVNRNARGLPLGTPDAFVECHSHNSLLDIRDLNAAIEELTTHSLVQASGFEEKVYSLHPLTQHFAVSRAAHKSEGKEPIDQG